MTKNILIIYYSYSGNTQKIANLIHDAVGGKLQRIEPKEKYPRDYNAVVEQAKREINKGVRPPLTAKVEDISSFDVIFIGSPNWWSTIAPPVATFLSKSEFAGKTIVPFFTHGGGGLARMQSDFEALCPDSTVLKAFVTYGAGRGNLQTEITEWLRQAGLSL